MKLEVNTQFYGGALCTIEKAMEACRCLLEYEVELVESSRNYPLFERYENPVQICLGMFHGGSWPSMVPDECTVEGGVGFLPNKRMAAIKQELEKRLAGKGSVFTLRFPPAGPHHARSKKNPGG